MEAIGTAMGYMAKKTEVPVCVHLDHARPWTI
ncbi:MAG: class II fructose-bisphosphate aldolase [Acutalibacter muris]|nr:class II fructose-bisphosphate aldolase [Acutalibacter muris]